ETLYYFGKGDVFTLFSSDFESVQRSIPHNLELEETASFLLEYFRKLKKIENFYHLRFSEVEINSITQNTINSVNRIVDVVEGNVIIEDCNEEFEIEFDSFHESVLEILKKNSVLKEPIEAVYSNEEIIILHGRKINLGYRKVRYLEPIILNLSDFID